MRIVFVGSGYVGLVSGAMLAHLGHFVWCIDKDQQKIDNLHKSIIPIYEPDLERYVSDSTKSGNLRFSTKFEEESCDAVFIAVGTPSLDSGAADLSQIYNAILEVADYYSSDTLIVIKSTVPPGTCKELQQLLNEKGYGHSVVSNPEFLREGNAIYDFLNPDRIVFGYNNDRDLEILHKIYKPLFDKGYPSVSTNTNTSEMIKYSSNAFLATKIAFINEMANLCESIGADVETLSEGIGLDHRIGKAFLKAGPGFGGSCFPKDIMALSHIAKINKCEFNVLNAVIYANQIRRQHMVDKIKRVLGDLSNKQICVLGITFKAGTDDIRSSPAVDIVKILSELGVKIFVYDPEGSANASRVLPTINFVDSPYEAAIDADCVVVLTEWEEFTKINFQKLYNVLKNPIIFDFRNIISSNHVKEIGFEYYGIGR